MWKAGELEVLSGMEKLMSLPRAPSIICEVSQNNDRVLEIVNRCKYKAYMLDNLGNSIYYNTVNGLENGEFLFSKE